MIGFHDGDRVDAIRQISFNPRHGFADIIRRQIQIHVRPKFRTNAHIIFFTGRLDGFHPRHPRHRTFNNAGDFGIHGFRRRAVKKSAYHNYWAIHIRQFAHFDSKKSRKPGNDDQQVQHHDQSGPTNRQGW